MFTNSFIYHHLFVFAWIETRLECNEINVTFTYVMYWNMKTNVTTCGNMFTNVVNMYFFFFCSQPGLRYFCVCIGHSNPVPVRVGTKILFKKANFQCLIHIRRAISAAEIQMEQLRQPPQGCLNVIDMEEEAEGEEDPPSSSGYNLRNK